MGILKQPLPPPAGYLFLNAPPVYRYKSHVIYVIDKY